MWLQWSAISWVGGQQAVDRKPWKWFLGAFPITSPVWSAGNSALFSSWKQQWNNGTKGLSTFVPHDLILIDLGFPCGSRYPHLAHFETPYPKTCLEHIGNPKSNCCLGLYPTWSDWNWPIPIIPIVPGQPWSNKGIKWYNNMSFQLYKPLEASSNHWEPLQTIINQLYKHKPTI